MVIMPTPKNMEFARKILRRGAAPGQPIPLCACFRGKRNTACHGVCRDDVTNIAMALDAAGDKNQPDPEPEDQTNPPLLCLRIEGAYWIAYAVQPGNMDAEDETLLGSITVDIVRDNLERRRQFLHLMQDVLSDHLKLWGYEDVDAPRNSARHVSKHEHNRRS